jgi:alanyl-tRNA synthetase
MVKKIAYDLRNEVPNLFLILGAKIGGKAHLTLMFDDELVKSKNLNAGKLIRTLAKNIQGGGGGQAFYASAGGRNAQGIDKAIHEAKQLAESL